MNTETYTIENGFFVWKGRQYATMEAMASAMRMIPTVEPLITKERPMSIDTNIPLNELTNIHAKLSFYEDIPTGTSNGTDGLIDTSLLPVGGIHPKDGSDDGSKGTIGGITSPKGGGYSGGIKNDAGKSRVDLIPSSALLEIGKVMEFGARKYAPNNWRKGFDWSRLYGAALRHLLAHKDGESTDKETGLSHLAHASCCLLFLLTHELEGLGNDDRPTRKKD